MKKNETKRSKIRLKNEPAEETNEIRTAAGMDLCVTDSPDAADSKVIAPGGEVSEDPGASRRNVDRHA